jgi:prepilin-type N-terminal cleavage/methylation domain-containing protein
MIRRGFTIVEMMIAMALTLIMVYAIAEFYAYVGETVRDGRAKIELSGALRTATQRLKDDLDSVTVRMQLPLDDGAAQGYIAFTEGICNDAAPLPATLGIIDADGDGIGDIGQDADGDGIANYLQVGDATNLLGDTDDVLAFTIRTQAEPFVAPAAIPNFATGIFSHTAMETSSLAEVIWWTSFTDNPTFATAGVWDAGEAKTVQRRLLLIRPDRNLIHGGDMDYSGPYYVRVPGTDINQAHYELLQQSDVSVRVLGLINGHVYFMANSLADLARRENRFMNVRGAFPNPLDLNPHFAGDQAADPWDPANNGAQYRWMLNGTRRGEDVVLSNALAFDLRVYDPRAVLRADAAGAVLIQPGDVGYGHAIANVATHPVAGAGAFVDMAYARSISPQPLPLPDSLAEFSVLPTVRSQLQPAAVFDTWALSYERDGIDQDGDGAVDEATNGLDDDGRNGVDDVFYDLLANPRGENETSPPYPVQLRGIEVRVRAYEPGTRQALQATVNGDFVAE